MKKFRTLLLICSSLFARSYAQDTTYEKGKNYFLIGYGFILNDGINLLNEGGSNNLLKGITGPFYLKYDRALTEKFSLGINIAYLREYNKTESSDYYGSHYINEGTFQSFNALLRFNWHTRYLKKLDAYYGVGMGYSFTELKNVWTDKTNNRTETNYYYNRSNDWGIENRIGFEATIGIKYLFNQHLGAYFETGFAKSIVQLGMVYKL